ncbi:GTP-binding protein [Babesia microti strain RI]|uniref:GTP-binding protein n=1 Tax=Babesia microti (strain RI) TaxID=1133968 RepID=A0A1R4AAE6_BABMR|nr:GTP-binding protein [Babesia microti strain RI]SJK85960.1 GTP-binding protein [Babesia microti strain RI]|eukprot:XP_021338163.1 GTP-binding protein [Babesia microti strain RI]
MYQIVPYHSKFFGLNTKLSNFTTTKNYSTGRCTKIFTSKRSFEKAVKPSAKIQRLVLENGLGRPVTIDEHKAFHSCAQQAKFSPIFLGQIKPKIGLCASVIKFESLPKPIIPEIAVAGRTNCGKSQLINSLCGQIGNCPIGKSPGTTRKLNFYKIGSPPKLVLVDLPGYGFAPVKEEKRVKWFECMTLYLTSRPNLKRVIIAIDSRLGLKRTDIDMLSFLDHKKIKWQVVLTKCDLVVPYRLCQRIQVTQMELAQFKGSIGDIIPISALRNQNLNSLRASVENAVQNYIPQRSVLKAPPQPLSDQNESVDLIDADYTQPIGTSNIEINYLCFDQIIENNVQQMIDKLCGEVTLDKATRPIQIDTLPSLLSSSVECVQGNNLLFDFEGVDTQIDRFNVKLVVPKPKPSPKLLGRKYTYPLELPKNESTSLVKQMPKSVALQLFPRLNLIRIRGSLKYRILGRNKSTRLKFSALRNMSLFQKVKDAKSSGITDWNKIYSKYIRWARKYPELASINKIPVSKAVVISEYNNYVKRTGKNTKS